MPVNLLFSGKYSRNSTLAIGKRIRASQIIFLEVWNVAS